MKVRLAKKIMKAYRGGADKQAQSLLVQKGSPARHHVSRPSRVGCLCQDNDTITILKSYARECRINPR